MKIWLRVGFLLILTACTKHEKTYLYVPQLYRDVALFQKNSHWVYLNEATLQIDSTYVNANPSSYFQSSDLTSYEVINVPFDGSLFIKNSLFVDAAFLTATFQPHAGIIIIQSNTEKLDSLDVNNLRFYNVYHNHQILVPLQSDSIFIDSYAVPHIGIIKLSKKVADKDTTLSLLRWNVIQ